MLQGGITAAMQEVQPPCYDMSDYKHEATIIYRRLKSIYLALA